jgi:anti-sigma factor ChrR (cupin superfamily)
MLDLTRIPWKATSHRGVFIHFFRSDPATGHVACLIRMDPGSSYPAHRHVGPEELLVLQGRYVDESGVHAAGDYVRYEEGSSHDPRCPDGTESCVFFTVAHRGIEILPAPPGG